MKNVILVLCFSFVSFIMTAQDGPRLREIGLAFSSLNNFGLTYKTGKNNSLWRFNALFTNGTHSKDESGKLVDETSAFNASISAGKEYRSILYDKLQLRYGADISFSYNHIISNSYNDKLEYNGLSISTNTYKPGINVVLGLNYTISDNLIFGVELLPGFAYSTGSTVRKDYNNYNVLERKTDKSGYSYGLNTSSALLTLAFRL